MSGGGSEIFDLVVTAAAAVEDMRIWEKRHSGV